MKYERVCQTDGEPVPWNEIVKGYEYEKDPILEVALPVQAWVRCIAG